MNRLDYHRERKKVTKHHFIRGTKQGTEGENEVKIENSAGVPFRKIEIKGNTVVEIKNQALEYSSYLSAIESYTGGGVSGTYAIKLPDGWQDKELTYKLEENTPLSGVDLYLASGSAFLFSDTLPLIENGIVSEQKAKNYTHLIFKGIFDEEIENENGDILSVPTDITRFWQGHSLIVTSDVCPEFPANIKNANAKEATVSLYGENLFDQGQLLTDTNFTIEKYNGFESYKLVGTKVNHTFPCEIPAGKLTVSLDLAHPETISNFSIAFIYEDGTENYFLEWNRAKNPEFVRLSRTRTTTKKIVKIQFRSYGPWSFRPYYIKDIMVCVGEKQEYIPYFKAETVIPSSVTIDGKETLLPLTIYDRLIVDGAGKRVIYEKRSGVREFKGTEAFSVGTFNNDSFAYKIELSRLGFKESTGNGYSTHFIPKPSTEIANRGEACFEYSSFGEKNVCFLYGTLGYSYKDMLLAENDFKAWMATQYEAGTPVTVVVEYKEPEMIDITNTDFGKSLLSLCLEQGKNGYLCLKSEPNATSLVCEYYSCQDQSKITLLVSYKDKSGTKIKEDKSYFVRKGAYYQISVPHIDGYTREMQEVFGKADADTTIDLIYTEE